MVNSLIILLVAGFCVAAPRSHAQTSVDPRDSGPLKSLEEILLQNQGHSEREREKRAELLKGFIDRISSSQITNVAKLIYASDLMMIGLANAGDERFARSRTLFQEIYESGAEGWVQVEAAFGLVVWFENHGNNNSEDEWLYQVSIGSELLRSNLLSHLDRTSDPYLNVRRIVGKGSAAEAQSVIGDLLRETYDRLGKDPAELEALLARQSESESGPDFDGVQSISAGGNDPSEKVLAPEVATSESGKETPDTDVEQSPKLPTWALALIVVAVLGVLVLFIRGFIRGFMRGRAS